MQLKSRLPKKREDGLSQAFYPWLKLLFVAAVAPGGSLLGVSNLFVAVLAVFVEGVHQAVDLALVLLGRSVAGFAFLDFVAFFPHIFAVFVDMVARIAFQLVFFGVFFMGEMHAGFSVLGENGAFDKNLVLDFARRSFLSPRVGADHCGGH
jgi:hypothetical protein